MRIISGKYRGKRIFAPKKLPSRPTTDMAKEGLFNILGNRYFLDDLSVLDLFSGTGNISYEFASRGATDITAVDSNVGCVQFISKTSKELDAGIHVVKADVFKFLKRNKATYDLIFADPPYQFTKEDLTRLVELVERNQLLKVDGLLILEHSTQTDLGQLPNFLEKRKYGSSVFSFFGK